MFPSYQEELDIELSSTCLNNGSGYRYGMELRNSYGCLRWSKIRSAYFLNDLDTNDVYDIYKEWVSDTEFLCLENINTPGTYLFLKAAKRGNDVYRSIVSRKLQPLENIKNTLFFIDDYPDSEKRTPLIFVTLTVDAKKYSRDTAWKKIGTDWNRFKSALTKTYGKIETFRTWESTKNGYSHVHAIIGFVDHSFLLLRHKDKDGGFSYRIPYNDVKKISGYWHSFVDVRAVNDTAGATRELSKYITKELCSEKGNKTNAMICLHNKQSYAVSKHFFTLLEAQFVRAGYDRLKQLLNYKFDEPANLIKATLYNSNYDPSEWVFVGVMPGRKLGFEGGLWSVVAADPPDYVKDCVDFEKQRQYVLGCDRL